MSNTNQNTDFPNSSAPKDSTSVTVPVQFLADIANASLTAERVFNRPRGENSVTQQDLAFARRAIARAAQFASACDMASAEELINLAFELLQDAESARLSEKQEKT